MHGGFSSRTEGRRADVKQRYGNIVCIYEPSTADGERITSAKLETLVFLCCQKTSFVVLLAFVVFFSSSLRSVLLVIPARWWREGLLGPLLLLHILRATVDDIRHLYTLCFKLHQTLINETRNNFSLFCVLLLFLLLLLQLVLVLLLKRSFFFFHLIFFLFIFSMFYFSCILLSTVFLIY